MIVNPDDHCSYDSDPNNCKASHSGYAHVQDTCCTIMIHCICVWAYGLHKDTLQ